MSSHRLRISILLVTILGQNACSSDVTAVSDPAQALLTVRMNVHAVAVAAVAGANTVQLSAKAYRGTEEEISDVVPAYTVSDNALHVTADGLVTGVKVTTNSYVVARVTYGGVTRTDTTWISVINTTAPAPLTTFEIAAPQSLAAGATERLVLMAVDANGVDRSVHLPITFSTSDARAAGVNRQGDVRGMTPERTVTIRASATVYGVVYEDSVSISIGYPLQGDIWVQPRRTVTGEWVLEFVPNILQISAGATVIFWNSFADVPNVHPIDVVFETPDAARAFYHPALPIPTGDGNIAPFMRTGENPLTVMQLRLFAEPGTYRFRSALYGSTGTLIVR